MTVDPSPEPLPPPAARYLRDALAHQRAGHTEQARYLFDCALRMAPGHPDTLYCLAMLHLESGQAERGISLLQAALHTRPDFLAAQFNLGMAWRAAGRHADAATAFGKSVAIDPDNPKAHVALANSLIECGQPSQAIESYRRAITLHPDDASLVVCLGVALQQTGAIDDAILCFRRALLLDPDNPDAHNDLGVALSLLNRTKAAAESFRRAIAADPAHISAHVNLGLALLRLGMWQEGWAEFECRLRLPDACPVPRWDGSPMPGGVLVLQAEQGFGDTLQFCRYVPRVAAQSAARWYSKCRHRWCACLPACPARKLWSPPEMPRDGPIQRCALGSLPRIFATTPQTIPDRVPYLHADAGAVAAWRTRLAGLRGMTVGLVWGGNPNFGAAARDPVDTRRSIPLAVLAPLAQVPGVALVSLQRGPAAAQLRGAPRDASSGMRLFDPTAELLDFADTAALVMALDLVISVDTSVAHLTGALGRPGWVLVRFDADWRWPWDGGSPWYPTLRQFRQRRRGEWEPVIAAIAGALAQAAARHTGTARG